MLKYSKALHSKMLNKIKVKSKAKLNSQFFKNVFVLVSGTGIGQLLSIVSLPLITRLYSPDEYGILTIYLAIMGILSFGSLEYNKAIPLAHDNKLALNILSLSVIITTIITLIISIVIFFMKEIFALSAIEKFSSFIYFVPVGVFFSGLYMSISHWAYREKEYAAVGKSKVSQSFIGNGTMIFSGFIGIGEIGLIIGGILKTGAGAHNLLRLFFINQKRNLRYINMELMILSLKKFKKFPLFLAPSEFFKKMSSHVSTIGISILFGAKAVGSYGITLTILSIPSGLIGTAVGNVFFVEVAKSGKNEPQKIKDLSNKLLRKLIVIGIFPLIIILIFGPVIFELVLGDKWREAGVLSRPIAVMTFMTFIFSPVSRVFEVFDKQKDQMFLNFFQVILVTLVFTVSYVFSLSSTFTITISCLVVSLLYLLIFVRAQKVLNKAILNLSKLEVKKVIKKSELTL